FWLAGGFAQAQAAPPAWEEHAQSVLELLMTDTQRALQAAKLRQLSDTAQTASTVKPKAAASPPARDTIRLLELFGYGEQLTAVLDVNGKRKKYLPGASL